MDNPIKQYPNSPAESTLGIFKGRPWLQCMKCQKVFQRERSEINKSLARGQRNVFCSLNCWSEAIYKTGRLRRLPTMSCPTCKEEFRPTHYLRKTCSKFCADQLHSRRMRGKNNSNYRAAYSDYPVLFHFMRPFIKERDDWQCLICGSNKKMEIHHLDEVKTNNTPENLATLCKRCHLKLHKSNVSPFPQLKALVMRRQESMTSKLRATIISLQMEYSSTTASYLTTF